LAAQSSTFKTTMAISVANHHDRDTAEIPDEDKGQSQTSQRGKRISAETFIAPFVTRGLMAFLQVSENAWCSGNILSARWRTSVTYAPSASASDQANVSDGMILVVCGERWIGRREMQ
jgi:hypothetical protein